MGVIRCFKKKQKKTQQTTDGHSKLETESAQWADSVKRDWEIFCIPPLACFIEVA